MNFKETVARANARLVGGRSSAQLAWIERGPIRAIVLALLPHAMERLFNRSATQALGGAPLSATIELNIMHPDGAGAEPFDVTVSDQGCTVARRTSARPDATVTIGLADMVRMGSGSVDPGRFLADGIATGRVELTGDAFLFLAFPNLFGLANRKLI